jgi:hypothetical protein
MLPPKHPAPLSPQVLVRRATPYQRRPRQLFQGHQAKT